MKRKNFDHFINLWQQLLRKPGGKPASDRRAARAKVRLRSALAAR
jgi:hypothetical protein